MYPKLLNRSYSLATIEHPKALVVQICLGVVVLAPDQKNVSVDSKRGLLHHASTIKLLSPQILMGGSYLSFRSLLLRQQSF